MSINAVAISGNLGSDPEMRSTQSGTSVLSFSVAVNERVKGSDGNWTDRANWIDCVLFGKRAEALERYLSKGAKVAIEGRLRWSQWDDRDTGKKRSKVEVVVDEVEFMSRRDDEGGRAYGAGQPQPRQADMYDEDIPF